jgi:rod shape-determining protein MreB
MLLGRFLGKFNKGIGVDLGSCNTLFFQQDRGLVINESSVVAINNRTDQILAIGDEARKMLGKTPPHIVATKPLEFGIISDFEVTEKMLKYFINKVSGKFRFFRPEVLISIPVGVTSTERRALIDAPVRAGAAGLSLSAERVPRGRRCGCCSPTRCRTS